MPHAWCSAEGADHSDLASIDQHGPAGCHAFNGQKFRVLPDQTPLDGLLTNQPDAERQLFTNPALQQPNPRKTWIKWSCLHRIQGRYRPRMLQFSKYQGLGNDFLIVEGRQGQLPDAISDPDPAWVRHICDRRFGVGADGLILALPPQAEGELRMRIINADGSEAEMCGNGIRCLARYLADTDGDAPGRSWDIETLAGMIRPELMADRQLRVDMGPPFLTPEGIPTTLMPEDGLPQGVLMLEDDQLKVAAVGMGNPHVVVPVEDLASIPFDAWGAALEVHPAFPAKTNVHFLQVHSRERLEIRVWERGAGPTLACGTGACATLVAAVLLGLADDCAEVLLPGGPLMIEWRDRTGSVLMTGPAEAVFDGVLTPELVPGPSAVAPQVSPVNQVNTNSSPAKEVTPAASPEDEAAALEQVQNFLNSTSLDSMLNLASESLEQRTKARFERGTP